MGMRDEARRLRAKIVGAPASFPLVGGGHHRWDPETHGVEKFKDAMDTLEADYARRPRGEPHPLYPALCKAVNRFDAVIQHFPTYGTGDRVGMCPYNLDVIVEEGRLEATGPTEEDIQEFEALEAQARRHGWIPEDEPDGTS
jgi:hypothetical protein